MLFLWAHKGPNLLESDSGRRGGQGHPLGSGPSLMDGLCALCQADVANPRAAQFLGEAFLETGLARHALSAGEKEGRTNNKPSFAAVSCGVSDFKDCAHGSLVQAFGQE